MWANYAAVTREMHRRAASTLVNTSVLPLHVQPQVLRQRPRDTQSARRRTERAAEGVIRLVITQAGGKRRRCWPRNEMK